MSDDEPKPELTGKEIAAKFAEMDKQRSGATPSGDEIDAATRAELEKWFGLPSFAQIEEGEVRVPGMPPPEAADPEVAAVRERRERAIAAVEPRMLDEIAARATSRATPRRERPAIELRLREHMTIADLEAAQRGGSLAEPREVELPPDMQDDLKECTPQALLRDLHRAELDFEKTFEVVDMAADQRLDIVAMVAEAMRTAWRLTAADIGGASPQAEATQLIAELRAERRTPWAALWTAKPLPNRKVTE
jgi:hypothetical protein